MQGVLPNREYSDSHGGIRTAVGESDEGNRKSNGVCNCAVRHPFFIANFFLVYSDTVCRMSLKFAKPHAYYRI